MNLDLTDKEREPLIEMLIAEIAASRYPLSGRVEMMKTIRAKLSREAPPPQSSRPRRPRR
jgi:hypothetical protein